MTAKRFNLIPRFHGPPRFYTTDIAACLPLSDPNIKSCFQTLTRQFVRQVGAPPEISILLEEIRSENEAWKCSDCCFGADPELDEFMVLGSVLPFKNTHTSVSMSVFVYTKIPFLRLQETYIDLLVKYKSDLEKPFDEATTFLHKIELQLSNLSTTDSFSPGSSVSIFISIYLICFCIFKQVSKHQLV